MTTKASPMDPVTAELLSLHALGLTDRDEAEQVERLVARDPAAAAELAALAGTVGELGHATPVIAPNTAVRARLMASIGGGRFERFATRFAAIFDVTVDRARELLGLVEDPSKWEVQIPGVSLIHFAGGPACAGADTGLVRIAAGVRFPAHAHEGDELTLVLSGSAKADIGTELRAGEEELRAAGTRHEFVAGSDEDLVYAVRAFGVRFDPPYDRRP